MPNQSISVSANKCYIFSDLHLAEGNLGSGLANGTENFFSDNEFSDLLKYLAKSNGNDKATIIFNGDFIDFIRITSCPNSDEIEIWQNEIDKAQKDYFTIASSHIEKDKENIGLGTNDFKIVWKLFKAMNGHRIFFEALAKWVDDGNKVIISRGNHDPEWIWKLVQEYFRAKLFEFSFAGEKNNYNSNINFINEEHFILNESIHIEHGHKYELLTKLKFKESATDIILQTNKKSEKDLDNDPENIILLPVGSFYNRYLINEAEKKFPHLDNISLTKALTEGILGGKIITIMKLFLNFLKYSFKTFAKEPYIVFRHFFFRYLILFFLPIYLTFEIYNTWGIEFAEKCITNFSTSLSFFLFNVLFIIVLILIFFAISSLFMRVSKYFKLTDRTLSDEALSTIQKSNDENIKCIIVGHNHNAKLIKGEKYTYVNTGTWTSKYVDKLEVQQSGVVYAYAEVTKDSKQDSRVELNEWVPQLNKSLQLTSFTNS